MMWGYEGLGNGARALCKRRSSPMTIRVPRRPENHDEPVRVLLYGTRDRIIEDTPDVVVVRTRSGQYLRALPSQISRPE